MANLQKTSITGSLITSSSLVGESVMNLSGTNGDLFTVQDIISGSLLVVQSGSYKILEVTVSKTASYNGDRILVGEGMTKIFVGTATPTGSVGDLWVDTN